MNIDDRYRARLQASIAALRYWCPSIADSAAISETDSGDYWEIEVLPHVSGACPFELVLRTDGFHDLVIAGESFEDELTDDLELFVPLASAIARGDVRRRTYASAATATPLAVETIVELEKGRIWQRRRDIAIGLQGDLPHEALITEHNFLPYRRS